MKKLFSSLLTVIVSLISILQTNAIFSDVTRTNPYYEAINYVQSEGIVSGYTDGTFRPDNTINRAEFTKIVIESQFDSSEINNCIDEQTQPSWSFAFFYDVPIEEWFTPYICVTKLKDIVSGYPDGSFRPSDPINFVEAAKIIVTAFEYEIGTNDVWYKPYTEKLYEKYAVPSSITNYGSPITRGEMAEIIYQLKTSEKLNLASKDEKTPENMEDSNLKSIEYNNVKVDVIIDKPDKKDVDVLIIYHGTATFDSKNHTATTRVLNETKKIFEKDNLLYVSVAYPEEDLLFGDNIKEAEAALLWVKNKAAQELNVNINRIYLLGHSQGGYLVTRLNTMHATDGVVANGSGPIDLSVVCKLQESVGSVDDKINNVCSVLKNKYGSALENPDEYTKRSLLNFASNYKSKILFVQGMKDGDLQIKLWPFFKEKLEICDNCDYEILEVVNAGHEAVFYDREASVFANDFLFN